MIDEDRVNEILQRVVEALRPDQETDGGFDHILQALEHAFVFQMALVCPKCRKNIVAVMTEAALLGPNVKLYATEENWRTASEKFHERRRYRREARRSQ